MTSLALAAGRPTSHPQDVDGEMTVVAAGQIRSIDPPRERRHMGAQDLFLDWPNRPRGEPRGEVML
jgi:hypothetical protein